MYNVPSFTLARAVGGFMSWYWVTVKGRSSTPLIILASVSARLCRQLNYCRGADLSQGFILGEGFLSILNLIFEGSGVPHF